MARPDRRLRVLVTGLLGQYAFGGVTWDYLQYVLGFRALGHDVWYLEDTGAWAYDPVAEQPSADCSYNVRYLARTMAEFDLGDRWIYRNAADGTYHGVPHPLAERLIREADVLVNVSGACWLTDTTTAVPCKLFVDGDPMFTHIGLATGARPDFVARVRSHTAHFSFGLNVGAPNCTVPTAGLVWHATVQPIALECWNPWYQSPDARLDHPAHGAFTTVMNWASYPPQRFEGEEYGQKDVEFRRFVDLPARTPQRLVIAMGQGVGQKRPTVELASKGWVILEPSVHLPDHRTYRDFLAASRGEWSIAKHGYVKAWTGWFSCRSACYLALGRPVVVQDTGWSEHLAHGEGVLPFRDLDQAVAAIAAVNADYEHHARAARRFCEATFEARAVCDRLLDAASAVA
jgi:hypothetical protein